MTRLRFVPVAAPAGSLVRFDTASGTDTPAAISPLDTLSVTIQDSTLRADQRTGKLPQVVGPDAVTTLYEKALDYAGNVTSVLATLTGIGDPSGSASVKDAAVIQASGDTTGAADTAALNAALAAVGSSIRGVPGATYYLNASVYLSSHSELNMTGCTIHLVSTALTNVLRNKAVDPALTFTDAAGNSTTSTLTSASAGFTAGWVGRTIAVVGGGAGGSTWYGTITAYLTPTTVTMSTNCDTTVAGATMYVYTARDSDITVRGGTWIVDGSYVTGHNAASTCLNSFATCFRRVDRLRLEHMSWATAGAGNQGGKFTISVADATNVRCREIFFAGTAGDGVHITGPASNVLVENISGTTGDDMVVCNSQDNNTQYITDTEGALFDIHFRNIVGVATWNMCRVYELGLAGKFQSGRVTIENLSGTTSSGNVNGTAIQITGTPMIDDLVIRDIAVKQLHTAPTTALVHVNNPSRMAALLIDGVTWTSTAPAAFGLVYLNGVRGATLVRNLRFTSAAPAGTNIGVYLTGDLSGASYGSSISIKGIHAAIKSTAAGAATFHPVYVTATTNPTQLYLSIDDVVAAPTTAGVLLNVNAATMFPQVNISNVVFSGTYLIQTPSSASTAVTARLSNVSFTGTSLASVGGALTLELANVDVNSTAAVVSAVGANATPVTILGNVVQAGAGAGVARDGTQVIRVNGAGYKVDQTLLTPADGDLIYNTNATPLNGVGVAQYNAGASKWKNVYSGTTN